MTRLRRSMLVLPADNRKMMEKAANVDVDVVQIDLEDAVDETRKVAARDLVVECLRTLDYHGAERGVMINSMHGPWGAGDIETTIVARPDVYLIPKVKSVEDVLEVDGLVTRLEQKHGLPTGSVALIAILEQAEGIINAREISRCCVRLNAIVCGSEDVVADIGATRTDDNRELAWAIGYVALCAGAARIDAMQFPVMAWKDLERLEHEAREAAILGYAGKIAIHPGQIATLNRVFSPSPEQVAKARAIVENFESARQTGGAIIKHDSQMMDAPHIKQAMNVLEKARRAAMPRRAPA